MEEYDGMPPVGSQWVFVFDGAMSVPDAQELLSRSGQTVTIIGRAETDEEILMLDAKFADGWQTEVWHDELVRRVSIPV